MLRLPTNWIAAIIPASLFALGSCETIRELAPTITDIQQLPDLEATSPDTNVIVTATARIDYKNWGYTKPYFTVAPSPETLLGSSAARLTIADCQPVAPDSTIHDCTARISLPAATWYYQWHLDYGRTSADTAIFSRPYPATDSFTIKPVSDEEEEEEGEDLPPMENEPLVLFDPEDGISCAGFVSGNSTIVPINWRAQSTDEHLNIGGRYQLMVEHPGPPNCTTAQSQGLNINALNAAWGYSQQGGCYFTFTNSNSTATPALPQNHNFRVRVRRIKSDDSFGPWTAYNSFTTASPQTCP